MLRSVYTRTASAMAALLAGALLLAGCASGPMTPSTDEPPPGDGAFPVTLHNAYGDVTIKERPKRMVPNLEAAMKTTNTTKIVPKRT